MPRDRRAYHAYQRQKRQRDQESRNAKRACTESLRRKPVRELTKDQLTFLHRELVESLERSIVEVLNLKRELHSIQIQAKLLGFSIDGSKVQGLLIESADELSNLEGRRANREVAQTGGK